MSDFLDGMQQLNDALMPRCRRCNSKNLTERKEEPIRGVPGIGDLACISFLCRDCGLDSTKELVDVQLTKAELDIVALGLQQLKAQYPKVAPLIDHLDSKHERKT